MSGRPPLTAAFSSWGVHRFQRALALDCLALVLIVPVTALF
ncbi:MAG: hypothetical protein M0014_07415 [Actinomycetota bacterium]|nr:hypothetical protein [Actinomycetota bacterium]